MKRSSKARWNGDLNTGHGELTTDSLVLNKTQYSFNTRFAERKGYAREAVSGMINWASEGFCVHRFIASISPENLPSLALVRSLGFIKVDEVMDEIDGMEHVYMLERTT
jgi:RimJ/RimL family protein N-acetyltransferase